VAPIQLTRFRYSGTVRCISCVFDYNINSLSKDSKRLIDAIDPVLVQRVAKAAHNLLVNTKPAREINIRCAGSEHRLMEQELRRDERRDMGDPAPTRRRWMRQPLGR